jgi:hypothetical protein
LINWDSLVSIATAIGVGIAAWQIWESRKLTSAAFEDSFDQQYRELSYSIPVDALLGKVLDPKNEEQAREAVYNYLDLCNEQVYQRAMKKVSSQRWHEWALGIEANLSRPFFNRVWCEVKQCSPGSFSFLEEWEKAKFKTDPVYIKNA